MAKSKKLIKSETYESVTGPIEFNLTNDYMFKAVVQESKEAQKGLISAVLMVSPESLQVEVINPVELGKSISEKDFYLDVNVLVNNTKYINLEMQISNLGNWQERSIGYLGRSFDEKIEKGMDYRKASAVHQIGFVNFDVFEGKNRFLENFKLKNEDSSRIFSDKFIISVVNLKRIDEATDKDKEYKLDEWCRLLTAPTWEELREIAKEDRYMEATARKMYELSSDFEIRESAIRRAEYYACVDGLKRDVAERDEAIAERDETIAEQNALIEDLKRQLLELQK